MRNQTKNLFFIILLLAITGTLFAQRNQRATGIPAEGEIWQLRSYTTERISSYDRTGANDDGNWNAQVPSEKRENATVIGKADVHLEVEGVKRHFIVYRPEGYTAKPLPVVFMFHGTSGNGERFYNISGWKEKADRVGLVAVFPSSLRYCFHDDGVQKSNTKWNDGKLEKIACPGQELKDDVLFFREMVNYLKENYNIDETRIYASGFSNGANFVSRLTFEASDILAATSQFAGYLQDTSYQSNSFIPSYMVVGEFDIQKNTGSLPPWDESAITVPGLHEKVMMLVDKLALEREYEFEQTDSLLTYRFTKNKGASTNEFRFSLIKDLPHRYPNGKNHKMVMADFFWDYYSRFSK